MIKLNQKQNIIVIILTIFGIFLILVIAGGFWWYENEKKVTRKTWEGTLDSIAELKKNQIIEWRHERMSDAQVISQWPILKAYLQNKEINDEKKKELLSQLEPILTLYDYDNILLLNKKGEVIFTANEKYFGALNGSTLQLFQKALTEKKIIFSSFYQCQLHETVHIDLVVPVVIRRNHQDEVEGVIIFIIEPGKFLYPLIQSWPTPSHTAETLLVQQQDNKVEFLNKLLRSEAAPTTFKLPLTEENLPAVLAIQGWSGALEGNDYRGVPVLAINKVILDTPWRLVAKIDLEEIDQPLYSEAILIATVVLSLILLMGAVLGWTLSTQRKRHFKTLYRMEQERQAIRTHFEYLVKYANDIILLMDREGNLKEANDRAVATYGYNREELLRLTIRDLGPADETLALFKWSRKDLAGVGKIYEGYHRRQDGSVFPVEVSVNLIQVEEKEYFQEIIRDISERKLAEDELRRAKEILDIRNRVSEVFLTVADDEMYAEVLAILLNAMKSEYGVFGYLDEKGDWVVPTMTRTIWHKCQVEDKKFIFPRETWGNSSWPRAIREKKTICLNGPSTLIPEGHVPVTRHISLPLIHQDKVVGLIQVANKKTDYTPEDLALLETIGGTIAPVLSARLQRERQKAARLQAEAALLEAHRAWEDIFQAISHPTFIMDTEHNIIAANQATLAAAQMTATELLSRKCFEIFHNCNQPPPGCPMQRLLTLGQMESAEMEIETLEGVYLVSCTPLFDVQGKLQKVIHICTDITARKRAEEGILKEKTLSDTIINSLPGVFYLFNEQGRFLRWNPNFEQVTGYPCQEFAKLSPLDLFEGEDRTIFAKAIREVFVKGESSAETYLLSKDGRKVPYFFTGNRLDLEGVPCLIGMGIDITTRKQAEVALRESEERFRRISSTISDICYSCSAGPDGSFAINWMAGAVEGVTGYSAEEVKARQCWRFLVIEADQPLFEKQITGLFPGSSGVCELRLRHKNGRTIWINSFAECVKDTTQPENLHLYGGLVDITDRKGAEASLALQSMRMKVLLDLQSLADAPQEKILDFILEASLSTIESEFAFLGLVDEAESALTIYRWSQEAMAQCALDDKPKLFPVSKAGSWGDCIRRRQAVVVNDYQASHPEKKGLPEGHVPIRRFLAVPVLDKGRVVVAAAVANKATDYTEDDVTAFTSLLNKMWEILTRRQAEESFRNLLNNSPMGIYIVQDGKFKMVNSGFVKSIGYSEEELVGRSSLALVAPKYREEVRQNAIKMLRGEDHPPYEFPTLTKSGKTIWVMEKVAAIVYQGQRAALGYFLDISERKSLESQFLQAQKMEAVGRLAGGVAHDFNNMLGVILGYSDIMQLDLHKEDPLTHNLAEIKKAAQRAAALTQQLLAFSRKQIIEPQVINLNTKIAGMEKMLTRLIGEDIDLAIVLDPSLEAVKADPGQIDQIIMNLAVNARDAMPQGGKLTLETASVYLDETYAQTHPYVIPGPYVMLAMSDNGQGMDAVTQTRIFEPFFTTKQDDKGSGLGLSTVYGIVKQNNGSIQVYSEVGQGTTFKIYLPQVQEAVSPIQPEKPCVKRLHGSETILVVEDEDLIRNFICRSLKVYGYNVLEARNGGEALLQCERYPRQIHLILTDVVMPQMNGRELVDRLKLLRPDLKVLYMSGYTADAVVHHGVIESKVFFLQKPFPVRTLVEKIRQILDETIR